MPATLCRHHRIAATRDPFLLHKPLHTPLPFQTHLIPQQPQIQLTKPLNHHLQFKTDRTHFNHSTKIMAAPLHQIHKAIPCSIFKLPSKPVAINPLCPNQTATNSPTQSTDSPHHAAITTIIQPFIFTKTHPNITQSTSLSQFAIQSGNPINQTATTFQTKTSTTCKQINQIHNTQNHQPSIFIAAAINEEQNRK